ncbi:MAG: hypothetical protein A2W34_03970 [Chloroflexi bacterium RBG_16_64_32]|nr:MAG: hypothetical protein A2W34_03970 [Chloroflexi bacterium RBG_16_64_32]
MLRDRDKPRLDAYRAALAFYGGAQWPGARATTRLRRLTVNYVRAIVLKTSSYVLKGAAVSIQPHSDSDEHTQAAAAAEAVLQEISDNNSLPRLDQVTEIDAAVLGDGAYKLAWDPIDQRVAITAPDVAGVFPWPHPTDPTRFNRVAHRYQLPAADCLATWGIAPRRDPTQVIEDWTGRTLDIYIDDFPTPRLSLLNPYGLIPFVIFPNQPVPKQWWGDSDVTPLQDVAKELNAEYSRISNIMELSGNPITVLEGVEQGSNIETFPGSVWELPEKAKAYLLDLLQHGGVRIHLDYLEEVRRALHDISETPRTAFGSTDRDLSGIALQVELEPLLQKISRKRLTRTDAYTTRAAVALRLHDLYTGTSHTDAGRIVVNWDPATPQDRTRQVADEIAQVTAALSSRRTSMAVLGAADPDAELQRWIEEARQIAEVATPATSP